MTEVMEDIPSSPKEPSPKKLKMSTTTTSDEDFNDATVTITPATTGEAEAPGKPRYKRRKVAIFFAYCGVGYQGMQKNPGAKTIEGDLEEALYHAGAVPEEDRGMHKRYDWARSARTDKGVSAVGQVASGRFYVDPPGFVDRLNAHLSPQIRIFGYKRVTPSYNAKKFCDRRRYVYLLPVFALDPSCHRDRESVMASLGSGNELVKCLECSERGRKVFGVMGKRSFESTNDTTAGGSETENELGINGTTTIATESEENKIDSGENVMQIDANGSDESNELSFNSSGKADQVDLGSNKDSGVSVSAEEERVVGEETVVGDDRTESELNGTGNGEEKTEKKSEFKYGEEEKKRFDRILKHYEGTHNFHNFTTRTKAEDPAAKRYIISFDANATLTVEGIEFVKCEVVGQSFMLHQIRKLIGMAVAIMRGIASESIFDKAFRQDVHINVPTAPEVGLYLDECFFTSYNNKWNHTHEELSMKDYADQAEEFKMKFIYSHIANTEHKEGSVALWLHSLNYRNYPDLRAGGNYAGTVVPVVPAEEKIDEMDQSKDGGDAGGTVDLVVPVEEKIDEIDQVKNSGIRLESGVEAITKESLQ